jgi:hypothetical protein
LILLGLPAYPLFRRGRAAAPPRPGTSAVSE